MLTCQVLGTTSPIVLNRPGLSILLSFQDVDYVTNATSNTLVYNSHRSSWHEVPLYALPFSAFQRPGLQSPSSSSSTSLASWSWKIHSPGFSSWHILFFGYLFRSRLLFILHVIQSFSLLAAESPREMPWRPSASPLGIPRAAAMFRLFIPGYSKAKDFLWCIMLHNACN